MNAFVNIPHDERVLHLKSSASVSHLRFEWHPGKRIVYAIWLESTPLIGEPIAYTIDNEGAAHNAVLIFLRGYKAASIWKPGETRWSSGDAAEPRST